MADFDPRGLEVVAALTYLRLLIDIDGVNSPSDDTLSQTEYPITTKHDNPGVRTNGGACGSESRGRRGIPTWGNGILSPETKKNYKTMFKLKLKYCIIAFIKTQLNSKICKSKHVVNTCKRRTICVT